MVMKPPEFTPFAAIMVTEMIRQAGFLLVSLT